MIFLLALVSFRTAQPNAGLLLEARIAADEIEILPAVLDFSAPEEADVSEAASRSDPAPLPLVDLDVEPVLLEVEKNGSTGDMQTLFGAGGIGLIDLVGATEAAQPTTEFFGTKIEGRRIVYLVDNSGGMREGEFETLVEELLRSVDSLSPRQQFYVIFYSDALYPLFYPRQVKQFVPANEKTKRQLAAWLDTVEFCVGNVVDEAFAAAESIRPDVVMLLTDGDLDTTRDHRRLNYLLDARRRRFSTHTFGMGTGETSVAAEKLRQVAEANGGTFRVVEVTEAARRRAETNSRPYHKEKGGQIWGLRVR